MPAINDIKTPGELETPDYAILSQDVRDIISYKPVWIVRNGILLFFIIFCLLFLLTFFISYPDVITVKGKLSFIDSSQRKKYAVDALIPFGKFDKIKTGQNVVLKFISYPESGTVKGVVTTVYPMPTDSGYLIKISLPEDLKTNFNKELQYYPGLITEAKIITADTKLSDRLFNKLRNF